MTKKRKKQNNIDSTQGFTGKVLGIFLVLSLLLIGLLKKDKVAFYYAMYFKEKRHQRLSNTAFETKRIHKIVEKYAGKTFGLDISHYQERKDINWEKLTIANGSIPLEFIVLRATMGNSTKDKNFSYFWKKASDYGLIRGAYHFYRPDEDPVLQANSYIQSVALQEGDFRPVLDIEKLPRRKSQEQYLADVQTWLNIVEKHYGKKPIIYTYYHFYKDYLRGNFDDYPLWLANYNDILESSEMDKWQIWQFTENGISEGVNSKIDLNVYNGSKWEMNELLLD